ncbi:MAG: V-type ATPase subunit [Nitrososphaerota archaeon]|nr:V-type ATPase subunit [Candidatus Bathyarchaeota archaeon]MCX8162154.1 V-type ATPase subunit [Candidatus Bathyarchaeota archaeon]MDW8061559.1 V-type ATPase subunit [Nitrososphaerota archaeon]
MKIGSDYAQSIGVIGALKSFMLKPDHYEMMMRVRDFSRILTPLRDTVYSSILSEVLDIPDIERRLLMHYYDVFRKVLAAAPSTVKPTLEAIYERYELSCLKTMIRFLARKIDTATALRMIIPVGRYDVDTCKRILSVGNVPRIVDFIEDRGLREAILSYMKIFMETGSTIPLESAIDRYAMIKVWNSLKGLTGYDEEVSKHLIGIETDMMNIVAALRAKNMGMDPIDVKGLLIPVYYRVGESTLTKAIYARSLLEAIGYLAETPYRVILDLPKIKGEEDLFRIEVGLKRYLARESAMVFWGSWLHAGIIIGFLNLKFYEVCDLITIINGKAEGLDITNIREALIMLQAGVL